ncbi:MAG: DJ-1/PfpI family protein [Candidatus Brocadiia bacterium]
MDKSVMLEDKAILMVIAPNDFRDEELAQPKRIFQEAGAKVVIASREISEAVGMLGKVKVTPDVALEDIAAGGYDAVIFVGGSGAKTYFEDEEAHNIANFSYEAGNIVGAICIAPAILANAGLLEGKKATCYKSVSETLKAKGAEYTGAAVEKDGRIITADGPESAEEFGLAVRDAVAEM